MTKPDWEAIKEKYLVGSRVWGKVCEVWELGARIELDDEVVGIIRNQEMSWDIQVKDARTYLHERERLYAGRRVQVVVLRHDYRKRQPVFSLRLAVYDPWERHSYQYKSGTLVRGKVVSITRTFALIEFPDHIKARLAYDEIVPWEIDSVAKVLDRGDSVEAIVKGKDDTNRVITLSMKDRVEQIGREIVHLKESESVWVSQPVEPTGPDSDKVSDSPQGTLRSIEQILIVDNVDTEGLQLEAALNDLDYENVDIETDFAEAVRVAAKYDLILMDVKGPDDDLAGIRSAEDIKQRNPDSLIVLVTGDDWLESSRRGQEIDLAGMILKPVTIEALSGALASLRRVGHAGWPVSLPESGLEAVEFVKNISRTAAMRRPLPQALNDILEQIAKATKADSAAIFSMHPVTGLVEMPAFFHISPENIRIHRDWLPKSPVNDVIYRGEHIHEDDVERFEGKYRNLRRLTRFNSCIGVPVEKAVGDLGYGLFLLHAERGHFSKDDLVRAEATATVIGQTIREHWVIEQVAADQRLTLLGSTITSIGHELRGRLGALEAVPSVQLAWSQLQQNPAKLTDARFVQKVESNLERLAAVRQGMAELTGILLGAVKQGQEQMIDVKTCLQSACNLVAHEATKAKVELMYNLEDWVPPVQGIRLELEQVFMNVLLNAIQQTPQSRRKRGRVTIDISHSREDKRFPIKVRFKDSGPGIHTKHLEKIFEPMYTTKSQGTGMGLYICKELLAMMGGQIRIEQTAILVGTTFVVELPAARGRR